MINLFCGYDKREAIGLHVFAASVLKHASKPVAIAPMRDVEQLGSNAFTYSRFLVPSVMGHAGRAIFMDGADMLLTRDIASLDALFDPRFAVQLVKHSSYQTRHRVKYLGTRMQCPNRDYERKNWASVMLVNCGHEVWKAMEGRLLQDLLRFRFIDDDLIGELPSEWNRLVDEGHAVEGAAVLHWTAGIPAFPHYASAPGADLWRAAREEMLEVA